MNTGKPPSKQNKQELRAALLGLGYTAEQLMSVSRKDMIALLWAKRTTAEGVGTGCPPGPATTSPAEGSAGSGPPPAESPPPAPTDAAPSPGSPRVSDHGWTQHVLGLFKDDEMDGQNPRVDGLRRVAELLIGTIEEEGCDLVAPPILENGNRACVKAWVIFGSPDGTTKRYEALADVSEDNCGGGFARFPTSTAETRARGRCFRTALKLRRVVAAEEMGGDIPASGEGGDAVAIQNGQIAVIQLMADRLNVSLPKLLGHLEIGKTDLRALTHTEGLLVAKNLNGLQQAGHIPPSLLRSGV